MGCAVPRIISPSCDTPAEIATEYGIELWNSCVGGVGERYFALQEIRNPKTVNARTMHVKLERTTRE
eukprot:2722006-Rhodomonas_salina.4